MRTLSLGMSKEQSAPMEHLSAPSCDPPPQPDLLYIFLPASTSLPSPPSTLPRKKVVCRPPATKCTSPYTHARPATLVTLARRQTLLHLNSHPATQPQPES